MHHLITLLFLASLISSSLQMQHWQWATLEQKLNDIARDSKTRDEANAKSLQEIITIQNQLGEKFSDMVKQLGAVKHDDDYDEKSEIHTTQTSAKPEFCEAWISNLGTLKLTTVNSRAYRFNLNNASWTESRKYCEDHGLILAKAGSSEENRALSKLSQLGIGINNDEFFWVDVSPGGYYTARKPLSSEGNDADSARKPYRNENKNACVSLDQNSGLKMTFKNSDIKMRSMCEVSAEYLECL